MRACMRRILTATQIPGFQPLPSFGLELWAVTSRRIPTIKGCIMARTRDTKGTVLTLISKLSLTVRHAIYSEACTQGNDLAFS